MVCPAAPARRIADGGSNGPVLIGKDRRTRFRPLSGRLQTGSGAIAQLVERLNGIQEVSGSTPLSSTNLGAGIAPPSGDCRSRVDIGRAQAAA